MAAATLQCDSPGERVGRAPPPLLLAFDEAGNVFRPRPSHLLTTARGNGVEQLPIHHDLAWPCQSVPARL